MIFISTAGYTSCKAFFDLSKRNIFLDGLTYHCEFPDTCPPQHHLYESKHHYMVLEALVVEREEDHLVTMSFVVGEQRLLNTPSHALNVDPLRENETEQALIERIVLRTLWVVSSCSLYTVAVPHQQ